MGKLRLDARPAEGTIGLNQFAVLPELSRLRVRLGRVISSQKVTLYAVPPTTHRSAFHPVLPPLSLVAAHPSSIMASTSAAASTSTMDASRRLLIPLHIAFVEALDKKRDSLAYHFTTHLRMNGVYWGLTALEILGRPEVLDRQALIDFVFSCWDEDAGGFGSFPGHDAHVHSTLSAIQILAMKQALDELDSRGLRDRVVRCES
ncbi:hypothetical protein PHSY_007423 [Pseudozyma hubeiensis SY62]|uniref:Geranylgeranyl transferase type II subunit beta n=1 Tax=Pseudozyma hubeiensis (strain SY62) TaxID=1305764 RepID=R9PP07_PSEHS|nr:hypothetical protein PHSY_007423 [Pseudozyma hubeiensis SY62]GAC99820.1 hypothetical protein PHSY_007423 [Pseudozyma hubeiensis SY62]